MIGGHLRGSAESKHQGSLAKIRQLQERLAYAFVVARG